LTADRAGTSSTAATVTIGSLTAAPLPAFTLDLTTGEEPRWLGEGDALLNVEIIEGLAFGRPVGRHAERK
jgi:hypothetical protein